MRHLITLLGLCAASSASAEVFVLGNTQSGHVVIRGNTADAAEQAHHEAKGIRDTGWVQLFGDDEPGWGAVMCVIHEGRYHFFFATGHKSHTDAGALARAGADRYMAASGGSLVSPCAPRWENRGQPLAFGGDGFGPPSDMPAREPSVVDVAKGVIRKYGTTPRKDYQRDCVPPPASAKAELRPIAPGAAPAKDKRPPAQTWKPATWCPPPSSNPITGVRG